jgi:xylan 1,4-beta-xylosidase
MAGLVLYYNASKFHYFYISHDEELGKHLRVMSALPDQVAADAFTNLISVSTGEVELRAEIDFERLRFAYRFHGTSWNWLPEIFDASILSDEASAPGLPNFTGAFAGVCCQDLSGGGHHADIPWFEYRDRPFAEAQNH